MRTALLLLAATTLSCYRAVPDSWAEQVARKHGQVDALLDRGASAEARRVLSSIIETAPPDHPQRRLLLQDARFRLARLALAVGEPATAQREADLGLALGDHSDLFAANLLVARGAAHEAQGHGAAAANDYERALAINETLLQGALPAP